MKVRSLLIAVVLVYGMAVALACRALDETAIRLALRLQGRLSFLFFIAVLVAPAAQARLRGQASAWLLRERSALCQAFCVSHLIHGGWILAFYACTANTFELNVVDISGALAFPLIALLLWLEAAPGRALAGSLRRRLSVALLAYAWLQFFGFFIDRLLSGRRPELRPWYVLASAICLVAALGAWRFRAQPTAPS